MTEDGWLILNGQKYRELVRIEMMRAKNCRSIAAFRLREKIAKDDAAKRTRIKNTSDKFERTKTAVLYEHANEVMDNNEMADSEAATQNGEPT